MPITRNAATTPRRRRLHGGTLLLALALVAAVLVVPATEARAAADEHRNLQWGLEQIRAPQAWQHSRGAGVTIAVVDSGVDLTHPDLAGKVVGGATFLGCPAETEGCGSGDWLDHGGLRPQDSSPDGHGTHVAGIAAAVTGNGIGIAGVAPDARILAVKALDGDGGDVRDVAAGIRWATRNGADVINLSFGVLAGGQALGLTGLLGDLTPAVREAIAAGVVVVAAAGNDVLGVCAEPAFDPQVLCVTATDRLEQRAFYSNFALDRGLNVVAAPGGQAGIACGEDVISTWPTTETQLCGRTMGTPGYGFLAGTSMAAPHVAGVAALLRAQGRGAAETVQVLRRTARTPLLGVRGVYTPTHGYGIVDADAAVRAPRLDGIERLAGGDRIATAAAVSRQVFDRADTVLIARSDDYADALAGAPLAAHRDGPLLLSARSALSSATAAEIRRLGAGAAVLLGGESALSARVADDLRGMGVDVRRIAGRNRFDTAGLVASELPATGEVFVTEGANADPGRGWPDALSASGLAAAQQRPILLVTRDRLPPETAAALRSDADATIVGGPGAVSEAVATQIDQHARTVRRLSGATRYATSARVAREAEQRGISPATTWVATGRAFADGLVAGAAAGAGGGVLLLVDGHDLDGSPAARTFLAERASTIDTVRLVGGRGAISERAEGQIREALAR